MNRAGDSHRVVAIVPARGGSKGLPGKNLRRLDGVPLLAWTIRAARSARGVDEVVVSTDDPDIAADSRTWGASCPALRPADLATDEAPTVQAIRHEAERIGLGAGDAVVVLQPTSPLRTVADIDAAIDLWRKRPDATVVTVTTAKPHPDWVYRMDADGELSPWGSSGQTSTRRQDLPGAWALNGAVYVTAASRVLEGDLLKPPLVGSPMPALRSVDIDEEADLGTAEALRARSPPGDVEVAGRLIGPERPPFIIAEVGVNHNGDMDTARRLIDVAAAAGADAVKFQTFRADALVQRGAPQAEYQARNAPDEDQWSMLKRYELSETQHVRLKAHAEEREVLFISSPFDEDAADLLGRIGVEAYKIPSGELTNTPFLRHVASKGKPMIISTGMADMREVLEAQDAVGGCPHVFLHCTSDYPAPVEHLNLRAMDTLQRATGVPVGYSDHSEGVTAAPAAVALGACILEKHITLDRSMPGPDHRASIEPPALETYVAAAHAAFQMRGDGIKQPVHAEMSTRSAARKSLRYAHDLDASALLGAQDLVARRPGDGLPPSMAGALLGQRLRRGVRAGEKASLEDLE